MKVLILLLALSFADNVMSQAPTERYITPMQTPTNVERYNIDYKLVDESIIVSDSSILNQIDLGALDSMRAMDHDVTVTDSVTNFDVILFYKKKSKKTNVLLNTAE